MRKIIGIVSLILLSFSPLHGYEFDPNDPAKIEIARHLEISPAFLRDPYLHDIYFEQKKLSETGTLSAYLDNGTNTIPMVSSLISQSDLPKEFLFVVLVESRFDASSTSSHGAAGLWQFMEKTGKYHGLKINQYVDERRDHVKSTRAAIAYLSQLHATFGKWYLALIAYNCGAGRLNRAIRKAGTSELKTLADPAKEYLPYESRRYIRKILSLALLSTDDPVLSAYDSNDGLAGGGSDPLATVLLPAGEPIDKIAAVIGMPKKNLKMLNTHLRRGVTPPNAKAYPVYIPREKLDEFRLKFRSNGLKGYFVMHKTVSGETLAQLAKRYKVSTKAIMEENMIGNEADLWKNRKLKIPIRRDLIGDARLSASPEGNSSVSVGKRYNLVLKEDVGKLPVPVSGIEKGDKSVAGR